MTKRVGDILPRSLALCAGAFALTSCAATDIVSVGTSTNNINTFKSQCSDKGLCRAVLTPEQVGLASELGWRSVRLGDGKRVAVQWVDHDRDGAADLALFAGEEGAISGTFSLQSAALPEAQVQFVLSQRVGAQWQDGKLSGGRFVDLDEIELPEWHKPGNRLLRYEGPAWESPEVAYRLYLDHRNGTDIFGKQVADLALDDHGLDGDDYHELKPWGADILKVGDSLGIGAPGLLIDGTVHRIAATAIAARKLDKGPHYARLSVMSGGWRPAENTAAVSVETHYSIAADSRLTRISPQADRALDGWVTGLVKHANTQLLVSDDDSEWQYLATFGKQSLFDDQLGMAVFYKKGDATPQSGDPHSHLIAFDGKRTGIHYFMGAWWQADPSGVANIEQFKQILEQERAYLARLPGLED